MLQLLFGNALVNASDLTQYLLRDGSLTWTKSVNQSWTCSFILRDVDGSMLRIYGRPQLGQPFFICEVLGSPAVQTVHFSGLISQIVEQVYPGSPGSQPPLGRYLQYRCTATSWAGLCDHRIVTAEYPSSTVAQNVAFDVLDGPLANEGIQRYPYVGLLELLTAPLTFNPTTVTDVFNQLRTMTGEQWWIDELKFLHFVLVGAGPNCTVQISDASRNWIEDDSSVMQVTTTSDQYRNTQYEMTSQPVGSASRTETFTANGSQATGWWFVTQFAILSAPTVTVNGVAQSVFQAGVDPSGQSGYYWTLNGLGVQQGQQIPPAAGAQVVVTYNALSISYVTDSNAAAIAQRAALEGGQGIWATIDQTANLSTADVAHFYGQGQLQNFSTIPQVVQFDSFVEAFDTQLGCNITFALTLHNLFGKFAITDISAVEIPAMVAPAPALGGTMRYTIKATNQPAIGNNVTWMTNLVASLKNATLLASQAANAAAAAAVPTTVTRSEVHGWYLASGTDLILTASFASIPGAGGINFQNSGKLIRASVQGANLAGQNLEIQVYKNGVPIFESGSPATSDPLTLFPGDISPAIVSITTHVLPNPLNVTGCDKVSNSPAINPDVFTIAARYVAASSPYVPVNAQDVYVQLYLQY